MESSNTGQKAKSAQSSVDESTAAALQKENERLRNRIKELEELLYRATQRAVSAEATIQHIEECLGRG